MSKLLNEALSFAAKAHDGQIRKSTNTPYILHPMEVASIVASICEDEDIMIAALLHDTIEDAGITEDEIRKKFGDRVTALVLSETENKRENLPAAQTWKIRKEESLAELKNSPDISVKILWLSDKLSNMRSLYRGWRQMGDDIFGFFNQNDKSEHYWYYSKIAEYVSELKETQAYEEFVVLISKVFK